MRTWHMLLGALMLTLALGIIGCGGGSSTTTTSQGSVRVQNNLLIFTPSADIANTLNSGDVTASFTSSAGGTGIPSVLLTRVSGSNDWTLNFTDTSAFSTVTAGTYSGLYTAQVSVFEVGKGTVILPDALPVTLNLVIGQNPGGNGPPPPPVW